MPGHDRIVVGASAGGVEALLALARALPASLPAALFVVLHLPATSKSHLPQLLDRAGPLVAHHPTDGERIQNGHIYVAPPDLHLLIEGEQVWLVAGPKENRHRPAVDPLFRSAAVAYGPRVVGVVLTGTLDDGTAGLHAIKRRGGIAVVQDPNEALYSSMPLSALTHVEVDYSLPLAEISPLLIRLAEEPADDPESYPIPKEMVMEDKLVRMDEATLNNPTRPGSPSPFSCPECGGVLWEIHDGEITRFRCRVGHAFSTESVMVEQDTALEDALWMALKTLEESVALSQRLARKATERGHDLVAARFEEKANQATTRASLIRQVLVEKQQDGLA